LAKGDQVPDRALTRPQAAGGRSSADFVLKLGGSAITHKDVPLSANTSVLKGVADELLQLQRRYEPPRIVIVYGGGSFGHPAARKYLSDGAITDPRGCAEVRAAMLSLAGIITEIFLDRGLPIFVINPSSSLVLRDGEIDPEASFLLPVDRCLGAGLMPALGGDVVLDSVRGARILSGDRIARLLARRLGARLLFGTDVDGVLLGGSVIRRIDPADLPSLSRGVGGREGDVTGGMAGKLDEIRRFLSEGGAGAAIFNITVPGNLTKVISGKEIECTYIGTV